MRVAFCIRKEYLSNPGGDTIQILETKKGIEAIDKSIEISIVTIASDIDASYDLVHIFNLYSKKETTEFIVEAKKNKLKIVLSTVFWDYKYSATRDLASLFNYVIPTTASQGNLLLGINKAFSMLINKPRIISKHFREYAKNIINQADLLLPNSTEEGKKLAEFINIDFSSISSKMEVVVNATHFNDNKTDEDFFNSLNLPSSYILQIGRIEYVKNQINTLRALMPYPEYPIVFIGKPSEDKYYKEVKRLANKRGNVFFIEQIQHNKLPVIFKHALLHVLPSLRESPGLVNLEALSMQCKIVVSNINFLPAETYFNKIATFVNPFSVKSIRKGILTELVTERDMIEISNHIQATFSWKMASLQTIQAYNQLLNIK